MSTTSTHDTENHKERNESGLTEEVNEISENNNAFCDSMKSPDLAVDSEHISNESFSREEKDILSSVAFQGEPECGRGTSKRHNVLSSALDCDVTGELGEPDNDSSDSFSYCSEDLENTAINGVEMENGISTCPITPTISSSRSQDAFITDRSAKENAIILEKQNFENQGSEEDDISANSSEGNSPILEPQNFAINEFGQLQFVPTCNREEGENTSIIDETFPMKKKLGIPEADFVRHDNSAGSRVQTQNVESETICKKGKRTDYTTKQKQKSVENAKFVSVSCQTDVSVMHNEELVITCEVLGNNNSTELEVGKEVFKRKSVRLEEPIYVQDQGVKSSLISSSLNNTKSPEPSFNSEVSFEHHSLYSLSDDDTSSSFSTTFLPSVGPPNIIKYQRETDSYPTVAEHVDNRLKKESSENLKLQRSLFSGPCQYCSKQILPLPTTQELTSVPLHKLFCCDRYENFIRLHLASENEPFQVNDEIIDIAPSEHFGTKAARQAAKERAAERLREREMEKQRAAAAQANFFSFTRQMKTIQYALSSQKCMNEGWTLKPSSPIQKQEQDEVNTFVVDVNTTSLQKTHSFHQRFYDDGRKFLLIFPDGSGCCYYPSGNVAVLITTVEEGKFSYIVFKNKSNLDFPDSGILAIFESNATGCCYFSDGSIRLVLSAYGGMQSDKHGNKLKRWQWNAANWHNHTPPLHPICLALNKHISVRVKEQDDIALTFTCAQRSVRFNTGAKLKPIKPIRTRLPQVDEHEATLQNFKQEVGRIFGKIEITLKFPNSPKLNKLPLPMHLGARKRRIRDNFKLPDIVDSEKSVVVN